MTQRRRRSAGLRADMHRALDGELSRPQTRRLQKALSLDPEARAEFEALRALAQTTQILRPPRAPGDLRERVLRRLREEA